MVDRTLKALLFAVVLGLWMQIVDGWLLPTSVSVAATTDERLMP